MKIVRLLEEISNKRYRKPTTDFINTFAKSNNLIIISNSNKSNKRNIDEEII